MAFLKHYRWEYPSHCSQNLSEYKYIVLQYKTISYCFKYKTSKHNATKKGGYCQIHIMYYGFFFKQSCIMDWYSGISVEIPFVLV